jgi:hypothetical protein
VLTFMSVDFCVDSCVDFCQRTTSQCWLTVVTRGRGDCFERRVAAVTHDLLSCRSADTPRAGQGRAQPTQVGLYYVIHSTQIEGPHARGYDTSVSQIVRDPEPWRDVADIYLCDC